MRTLEEAAATKDDAGGGARFEKIAARGHGGFLPGFCFVS
jgi:hypothetical protein